MPRNNAIASDRPKIILASGSRHRAAQIDGLGLPYEACSPDIDETPQPDESVHDLVLRLGAAKAQTVCERLPGHIVIASDQSAAVDIDGELHRLGKPGTPAAASKQLQRLSGREVAFMTSLVVRDERPAAPTPLSSSVDVTHVRLRPLSDDEISRYLASEDVLDCAGSFRVESRGIALFERIRSDDPTALVGLPLIRLCAFLRACGVAIP